MTLNPIYSADRSGARFQWHVEGNGDYSNQVAQISGITQKIDFSGGISNPEITITLGGAGLWGGDGVGGLLKLSLDALDDGVTIPLGWFKIRAIDALTQAQTGQKIVTITAIAAAADLLPDDYNYYDSAAQEPRNLVKQWIFSAGGGVFSGFTTPAYSDSYQREYSRVAAPAATLAGLAGFSDTAPTTRIRVGNQQDSSTWPENWVAAAGAAPAADVQWNAAPGLPDNRSFLGKIPLYWHQAGQYWLVRFTGRKNFPALSTDKCQFPLGAIEGLYITIVTGGGTDYQQVLGINNHTLAPTATEEVEITFKSRKEAREFYRQNKATPPDVGPDYGWGFATYRAGAQSDIKRWGGSRTVKITNVAKYTGVLAAWYADAKAVIAPTASTLDYAQAEAVNFGELVLSEDESADADYTHQRILAGVTLQFVPQRLDAAWKAAGVTSYLTLTPGYQIEQELHPVTIAQDYTTRALMQQACILGSLGLFPSADFLTAVDTCPESGAVFGKKLDKYTVADIQLGTEYPMPASYDVIAKTPENVEYHYNISDNQGTGGGISLSLLQGTVQGLQAPVSSGGVDYLSLSSTSWGANPGGLADRWTGSQSTFGSLTGFSVLSFPLADRGAVVVDTAGKIYERTGNVQNFTAAPKYATRDMDGTERKPFCAEANIGIIDPPAGGKESAPLLDAFPLFSFLKAHARAYKDNYNRQSWRLKVSMIFASCKPGDIVTLQLDQILSGQYILALVIGVSISTDSFPELEVVPMHVITNDDYNNFTGL